MNLLPASARRLFAALFVALAVVATAWPSRAAATNAPATNAPSQVQISGSARDADDDDDTTLTEDSGKHHVTHVEIRNGSSEDFWGDLVIPLAGIAGVFGSPVLIVLVVMYFHYRRKRETLVTVREFLNKGMPVPPELLAGKDIGGSISSKDVGALISSRTGRNCDLRRGYKLTFIGLGVALALYVSDPHSTTWGWGLIPMVMGIGYLVSGWTQGRDRQEERDGPPPPTGNPSSRP